MASITPKKILITGASGRVAKILVEAWAHQHRLILLDIKEPEYDIGGSTFIAGNVTDKDLTDSLMRGVDAVVHLALKGNLGNDWCELEENTEITRSVFQAAAETSVKRVIFASTVWIGISVSRPYSAVKQWGEMLALQYTRHTPLSIICLRVGGVAGHDDPRLEPGRKELGYLITLSDTVELFTQALESPDSLKYGVFYGLSANSFPLFDITPAKKILGYNPKDDSFRIAFKKLLTANGLKRLYQRAALKIKRELKRYGIGHRHYPGV